MLVENNFIFSFQCCCNNLTKTVFFLVCLSWKGLLKSVWTRLHSYMPLPMQKSWKCGSPITPINFFKSKQLHMVSNNPTKFEQNLLSGFKGVVSTKCSYIVSCTNSTSPTCITPVKYAVSKWWCNMTTTYSD